MMPLLQLTKPRFYMQRVKEGAKLRSLALVGQVMS